jgi:hypothetical protein
VLVSRLRGRLQRLEGAVGAETACPLEAEERARWMARARVAQNEDRGDWHAADTIRLLRMQGRLGTTAEDLRARLLAWRPALDESAVDRELARMIHLREPGTENMVCPPEWAEAFEAADELREHYAAVPDGVLARWVLGRLEAEGRDDEVGQESRDEAARHGITDGALWEAIGPDVDEIPDRNVGVVSARYSPLPRLALSYGVFQHPPIHSITQHIHYT